MSIILSQMFPPAPTFTPKDLPSLAGKVFIITGAASGVGFELAKILYAAGGSVYIGARSTSRCSEAIKKVKFAIAAGKKRPRGKAEDKPAGKLGSMVIDLADLATIKPAAVQFMQSEERLDGLIHNAGVMVPPVGSKDVHGHDLETGVHCLAPYLLTLLLEPILLKTAESAPPFSVRIVFVVSMMHFEQLEGGMSFMPDGMPKVLDKPMLNYIQSKVGESWIAAEFAKRLANKKVLSVSLHPGFLRTELQRHLPSIARLVMSLAFKPPVYGAYSELYATLSPELKEENNGGYILAWGRVGKMQKDIAEGLKSRAEGGTGNAAKFMEYCNREVKLFH